MQRLRFLLFGAVVTLASMPPLRLCADEPLGWRNPDAIMSFKTKGRLIRVPVTIGDKTYFFALDTGSSMTVVDESLCPHLGLEVGHKMARTGFGEVRCAIHLRPEMQVGDAKFSEIVIPRGDLIAATDLSVLRQLNDPEIFGILGQDLMCKWVVMVSFDGRVVAIWSDYVDASVFGGRRVPMHFKKDNRPYVRARIATGEEQDFLIDTGAMFSVGLPQPQYDQLLRAGHLEQSNVTSVVSLGAKRSGVGMGRPLTLKLSDFEHVDLVAHADTKALLGLMYWRRYRVIFDFPGQSLILVPSESFEYPDVSDHDGIHVEWKNDRCVLFAAPGSRGYEAGIRDGDVATMINGVQPSGSFERALGMNYIGNIRLTIQRDNEERHIVLPRPWSERDRGEN